MTSFGEKLQVSFSEILSMAVHLSLCSVFSRDHTSFFFSSETKKKLSSEVSALKAELDVCLAELETER